MKHLALSALSSTLALCVTALMPGDLETVPNPTTGQDTQLRWAPGTGSIPWNLVTRTHNSTTHIKHSAGAIPPITAFPGHPPAGTPGVDAMVAAAATWNNINVIDDVDAQGEPISSTGTGATTVQFSTTPTYMDHDLAPFTAVSNVPQYFANVWGCTSIDPNSLQVQYPLFIHTLRSESAGSNIHFNTIDFVQSLDYWSGPNLGHSPLATSVTRVRAVNGIIQEFDIGLYVGGTIWTPISPGSNCYRGSVQGNYMPQSESPTMNRVIGLTGGTYQGSWTPPATIPQVAFFDIQGTLTHAFGHALGLGHTFETSRSNIGLDPSREPNDFPTMFPLGQSSRFEEAFAYSDPAGQAPGDTLDASNGWGFNLDINDPSTWPSSSPALQDIGTLRGILGYSARSLELDDIAAISRGYASSDFTANRMGITGKVTMGTQGYRGAVVTAFEWSSPNTVQASTLTYADGGYLLTGLPKGDYVLRVEPAPVGIYNQTTVPTFPQVWPNEVLNNGTGTDFPAEYWNTNDVVAELPNAFTTISLGTPGQLAVADFELDPVTSKKALITITGASATGTTGVTQWTNSVSNRRLMPVRGSYAVSQSGAQNLNATVQVTAPVAYAGGQATIFAARELTMGSRFGQLYTVVADPQLIVGGSASVGLDGNAQGGLTVPIEVKAGDFRDNVVLEAYITAPGQPPLITNTVSAWFSY